MTPDAKRVLQELAEDEDCDLAEERGTVYCGNRRTTRKIVDELIWLTAIKVAYRDQIPDGGYTCYDINETGHALLRRPELEGELQSAIAAHRPFSIKADKIEFIDGQSGEGK